MGPSEDFSEKNRGRGGPNSGLSRKTMEKKAGKRRGRRKKKGSHCEEETRAALGISLSKDMGEGVSAKVSKE